MKKIAILLFVTAMMLQAQYKQENLNNALSGNLLIDSKVSFDETKSDDKVEVVKGKKSPFLAGVMSIIVPGAGQVYNGDYIKAVAFIAAEATGIAFKVAYDKKGDDQTEFFEGYANEHWSVNKYATWTYNTVYPSISVNENDRVKMENLIVNGQVDWEVLHKMESHIPRYSHNLEYYGLQQYYEMIGKYNQFASGWDDFDDASQQNEPSERYLYYADERGKANDYYNIGRTALILTVLNHFASAIEAAWTTSRYNKSLDVNFEMKKETVGFNVDYYPEMNIKLAF